ncbi:uncharacterized protein TNCV_2379361 [Trichonephila clavipes]|uniref:Uncharacterized protein n=1 Tax=Trichonephila clavipes TaxID=2585209 RepID=A0A8X6V550_TRICX|nr:uncharacterized protein TNCV_2379361 [Trichonephila clavipes]
MNGLHLALRHERQKVNRIVMTSERIVNCPPVKEWPKNFGFDSFGAFGAITGHMAREASLHPISAVLNHKILEANSQVQNVKLGCHPTCLSINRLWHELCDMLRRRVGTTAPGHHDCSIQE